MLSCGARAGLADMMIIIITPTGTDYYQWIVTDGLNVNHPAYGSMLLKRVIQQRIENPIAAKILRGEFADGDTIQTDVHSTGRAFQFKRSAKAAEKTQVG
jgi:ATP-dependent Clp protease ATP-binding subunit ClpA